MQRHYFDYAAATPVDPRVEHAMKPYWSRAYGNPGALHSFGQEASAAVFKARKSVADMIGCAYDEIIFTGSATEANNLALRGIVKKVISDKKQAEGDRTSRTLQPKIIVSAIEHDSVLDTARSLEKNGVEVVYLPVSKKGIVDVRKLEKELDDRTVLVSVMYANNEVGTIQPIREISKVIKNWKLEIACLPVGMGNWKFGAAYPLLHTDAVQAFNYLPCKVNDLGVDLMTLSSQKIYGPKGVGALYVRNVLNVVDEKNKRAYASNRTIKTLEPLITGGSQEFGLRAGTENVPGIVGFTKAAEITDAMREKEARRLKKLQEYFFARLRKVIPKAQLNGDLTKRLPNNADFYIPGVIGQELIIKLDLAGYAVSPGAACTARVCKPSHVLKALGYSDERAENSIRVTFGRGTAKAEIDALHAALTNLLKGN